MTNTRWFKFEPSKELWIVLLSWILVVGTYYLSFQVITTQRVAAQFITFGIIGIMLLGIIAPAAWNCLVMGRPLSGLGISTDKLVLSVALGLILTAVQYYLTLRNIELPEIMELIPLATMALAVGLYENIFYRGWIQLRMEESFGILPGILLSSILYSFYHIGYGMAPGEMLFLFLIGVIYSTIFRLTANIFILFPFLTPTGAMFTQIKEGLNLPFPATYGFVDVIVLAILCLFFINKVFKKTADKANRITL